VSQVDDLIARGRALCEQEKKAKAVAVLKRATALAPTNVEAWLELGMALYCWRDEQALAAFEQAIALAPGPPDDRNACFLKANALNNLLRYEEALAAVDQCLGLDAEFAGGWFCRSYVLRNMGRVAESEAAEHRARELGLP
jgi:tetratricopeptide (TPR) repeat protein